MKKIYTLFTYAVIIFVLIVQGSFAQHKKTMAGTDVLKLPVFMYHGFTDGGAESEYVTDIKKFESDVIYLRKNGFTFIDTNDLVKYIEGQISLPEKCVMLTFDDGYLNNYSYAFPIIKKHNVKTVISPIAYYVEYYSLHNEPNPQYSQLTDKEIKEMHASGLVDFQNHSYNMHSLDKRNGSSKLKDEKDKDYVREFFYDLKAAENVIKDITGKKTHAYVYPFGSISQESGAILKCCGYKLSFGCEEGFNHINKGSKKMYMLKRFNRTPQNSVEHFLRQY